MACFMSRRLYRPKRRWQPACPHCHLSTPAGVSGMSSSADRHSAYARRLAGTVESLRWAAVQDCHRTEESLMAEHRAHQTARLPQSPAAPSRLSGPTGSAPGGCCWAHPATAPPHPRPEQATDSSQLEPLPSTRTRSQPCMAAGSTCKAVMGCCTVTLTPYNPEAGTPDCGHDGGLWVSEPRATVAHIHGVRGEGCGGGVGEGQPRLAGVDAQRRQALRPRVQPRQVPE